MWGISVVITTRNRPTDLQQCIRSLLANSYRKKEIIIVDQSTDLRTNEVVRSFHSPCIRYIRMHGKGASNGRNRGAIMCTYDIVAFTDDDCIVSQRWAREIAQSFHRYPNIVAVFGQVLPAKQETRRVRTVGVNRFTNHTFYESPPHRHLPTFVGNNWSIRKKLFLHLHGFKSWLGPGSIGFGAEEDEMLHRILTSRHTVYANPLVKLHHTHTLTKTQYSVFYTRYGSGFFMLFSYYMTRGDNVARRYMQSFIHKQMTQYRSAFTRSIRKRSARYFAYLCFTFCYEILYYVRGALLGSLISARDAYFRRV